jgi:hypothetical protein
LPLCPVRPPDGGRALLALSCSPRLLRVTGLVSAAGLLALGLYGAAVGLGLAPLLPGLFLLLANVSGDSAIRGFTT